MSRNFLVAMGWQLAICVEKRMKNRVDKYKNIREKKFSLEKSDRNNPRGTRDPGKMDGLGSLRNGEKGPRVERPSSPSL